MLESIYTRYEVELHYFSYDSEFLSSNFNSLEHLWCSYLLLALYCHNVRGMLLDFLFLTTQQGMSEYCTKYPDFILEKMLWLGWRSKSLLVWAFSYCFVTVENACVSWEKSRTTAQKLLKYFTLASKGSTWAIPCCSHVWGWCSKRVHNLEAWNIDIYCPAGNLSFLALQIFLVYTATIVRFFMLQLMSGIFHWSYLFSAHSEIFTRHTLPHLWIVDLLIQLACTKPDHTGPTGFTGNCARLYLCCYLLLLCYSLTLCGGNGW